MSNKTPSESKEEMKQEFKKEDADAEDADAGGGPETDREKNQRWKRVGRSARTR